MDRFFSPAVLLIMVPVVFAAVGGYLAHGRGRNVLFWGAASAIFPICIMIVWFEKPLKEVEGKFRKCRGCGEWLKWRENPCKYCGADQ